MHVTITRPPHTYTSLHIYNNKRVYLEDPRDGGGEINIFHFSLTHTYIHKNKKINAIYVVDSPAEEGANTLSAASSASAGESADIDGAVFSSISANLALKISRSSVLMMVSTDVAEHRQQKNHPSKRSRQFVWQVLLYSNFF
jgi:hypothetical protein